MIGRQNSHHIILIRLLSHRFYQFLQMHRDAPLLSVLSRNKQIGILRGRLIIEKHILSPLRNTVEREIQPIVFSILKHFLGAFEVATVSIIDLELARETKNIDFVFRIVDEPLSSWHIIFRPISITSYLRYAMSCPVEYLETPLRSIYRQNILIRQIKEHGIKRIRLQDHIFHICHIPNIHRLLRITGRNIELQQRIARILLLAGNTSKQQSQCKE